MYMDKPELRQILKNRRMALPSTEREQFSEKISRKLSKETDPYQVIMSYASKNPEVSTTALITSLLSEGKTVVVPITELETHTLRLSCLENMAQLKQSTFNVPEPIGAEIPINASEVECVILPMVGFDRFGNRIGYGAGYYDRFLAQYSHMKKIGIAFSCQEVESIPIDIHDVRMDVIVTENQVYYF